MQQRKNDTDVCITTVDNNLDIKGTTTTDAMVVRRRLKQKLDLRFVVWAFLGYFATYLDRSNLPNAYVSGMKEDLLLESSAYNWADTVMRLGYNLIQIPGCLILPKVYPRWFLPTLPLLSGVIQCCMSLVKNHQGLLALRFCLGLAQSIFQPGIVFLLGNWYIEQEVTKRVSIYKASMGVSGAVGGLIAGSIVETIADKTGLRAWQWLFVVEGLIAIFVGILGYFMVPNYPHQATSWITEQERTVTMERQASQKREISAAPYSWRILKQILLRPYTWLMTYIAMSALFMDCMASFFVVILKDMGYDSAFANYMSTPLNLFNALTSLAIGYSSDWFNDHIVHTGILAAWGTIWSIIVSAVNHGNNPAPLVFVAAYAFTIVDAMISLVFVWVMEIYKGDINSRAMALGLVNGLGLLIPSFAKVKLWVVTDSPVFWLGKISNVGIGCGSVVAVLLSWFLIRMKFMLPTPIKQTEQHDHEEQKVDT
ncbi:nicotinamide mononucleotide permease [Lichtheimia corymbifera JMRC:FSU:9682]|uniref:Nicotinamide mononucleotide permease n=1 Tax=Lichtheimia corymbifera JMRC:FSU:9682 TaxID=1263082 RepID=A0A068RK84_9FUNG|nr:nicotinamide mononucleotide permease [Lichtheimia corymbifera JMRC:FSU:9682]